MKITLSRPGEITAEIPSGDTLARHAADAYHSVLNTSARIGREHSGPEFAAAIAEVYDCTNGRNKAVVSHLMTLK